MVNLINNSETIRAVQQDIHLMRIKVQDDSKETAHNELLEVLSELYRLFANKVDQQK